jgi:hypothetical protein
MRKVFVAAAAVAIFALLASPALGAQGGNGGGGSGDNGHITVPDAVYGGMTTATVNPGGDNVHVLVKCYTADGSFVYAANFPMDTNKNANIGPLWSTLWSNSSAECLAEEGYYTRNGFGEWTVVASTTVNVSPAV